MRVVSKSTKGPSGIAKVAVGDKRVEVAFEDGESYKFPRSECPEYLTKSGKFFVTLAGDEESILGVRPINGYFKAKFKKFASREGEAPSPMEKTGKWGPYLAFMPILEIVDERHAGMEVPYFLQYKFAEDEDGLTIIDGGGKSGERLATFLEVTGIGDRDIKFSDNILPKLEKYILQADATFGMAMREGNVEYLAEEYSAVVEEPDDEDDEPVAKKPAKPTNGKPKVVVEDDDEDDEPVRKPAKVKAGKRSVDDDDDEDEMKKFDEDDEDYIPF